MAVYVGKSEPLSPVLKMQATISTWSISWDIEKQLLKHTYII